MSSAAVRREQTNPHSSKKFLALVLKYVNSAVRADDTGERVRESLREGAEGRVNTDDDLSPYLFIGRCVNRRGIAESTIRDYNRPPPPTPPSTQSVMQQKWCISIVIAFAVVRVAHCSGGTRKFGSENRVIMHIGLYVSSRWCSPVSADVAVWWATYRCTVLLLIIINMQKLEWHCHTKSVSGAVYICKWRSVCRKTDVKQCCLQFPAFRYCFISILFVYIDSFLPRSASACRPI